MVMRPVSPKPPTVAANQSAFSCGEQVRRGGQHPLSDLGLRPDAKEADALDFLDELVLAKGARHRLYLIASLRQSSRRVRVNVLQQQGTVERVQRQHLFPTKLY